MSEQRMAYCARIAACGCVYAAAVDDPAYAKEHAKEIARWIREGAHVERLPIEEIRALPWGWPCEHMKAEAERAKAGVSEDQTALEIPA